MENLKLKVDNVYNFVSKDEITELREVAERSNLALHEKTGKGDDFLGWVNLPSSINENTLQEIEDIAKDLIPKLDILVVVGIGGSYLGSKAVIDALSNNFNDLSPHREAPLVLFAGQNISEDYMVELREVLKNCSWGINVISKSGTTTEPALAFRILKQDIEDQYGKEEAAKRIVAVI